MVFSFPAANKGTLFSVNARINLALYCEIRRKYILREQVISLLSYQLLETWNIPAWEEQREQK